MVYETLTGLFKKHFYIVFQERFKNELGSNHLERFVAKHPLLKPELIVVNDQIHGFKKMNENARSLEKFPIYFEIEYTEEDGNKFIENVDLYSEVKLKCHRYLSDIIYLSNMYSKTINIDRVKRINDPSHESLILYSKLNEQFVDGYLDQDVEDGLITSSELSLLVEGNFLGFINFIKLLDDVIVHGKRPNLGSFEPFSDREAPLPGIPS